MNMDPELLGTVLEDQPMAGVKPQQPPTKQQPRPRPVRKDPLVEWTERLRSHELKLMTSGEDVARVCLVGVWLLTWLLAGIVMLRAMSALVLESDMGGLIFYFTALFAGLWYIVGAICLLGAILIRTRGTLRALHAKGPQ